MWKRGWIERGNGQTEEQKENQSGLAEGKKERSCRRRGKTENQNGLAEGKIEIAKNLIKLGINIDDIIKATGLSKEEIEKLTEDK